MALIDIPRKKKIIINVILVVFMGLGYYLAIYESFGYRSVNFTLGLLILYISFFCIPFFWFKIDHTTLKGKAFFMTPMVILAIVLIFTMMNKKDSFIENEVNSHGVNTIAKVTGFEKDTGLRRKNTSYFATIQYVFEGKTIVQRIENDDHTHHMDEKISIRFSKNYPAMFLITDKIPE